MNDYTSIRQDTPRLVVEFSRPDPDNPNAERFTWGMLESMRMMTLIGYIIRVQAELAFKAPKEFPHPALVIVQWEDLTMDYFVNKDIPVDSLVGMLETVKVQLLAHMNAQKNISSVASGGREVILGRDGRPLNF